MNVILFLGSGVSYKTGLPNTNIITEQLLNGDWWRHSDSNFYKGINRNEYFAKFDITPKLQGILRYIKEYSDNYLKDRRVNESNYEDIYYLVKQIHNEASHESDNPGLKPFIEHLNSKFNFTDNPDFKEHGHSQSISDIFWKCEDFINCVVWDQLSTRNKPVGFNLVGDLINEKNIGQINIVTLNHDLLIERYLKEINCDFTDGFTEPDGDICYFKPQLYESQTGKVNLFKLHGSLDWYRVRDYVEEENTTYDLYAKLVGKDHWRCKNSKGKMLSPLESYPIFITGTYNKQSDYSYGIVRYVHLKFFEKLSNTNIIIMSGYGWNDKGINTYLFEWIMTSQNRKIILLHEDPESIKDSKSAMWHRYDDLIKWGRLILVKSWMSDTKLNDISKYLN